MRRTSIIAALSALAAAAGWFLLRDQTTDNDQTGQDVGKVPIPQGSSGLGSRAVEVLSRHVGERGTDGYHRSPFIDTINLGVYGDGKGLIGKPWCARAGRWAYEIAARELGLPPPFSGIKSTLANVSTWKSAPFKPFFLDSPKVGAALLLGEQHFTIIAKIIDDRTAVCIEGNHGDSVAHVKRTIRPQDTIVDVESYAAQRAAVVGFDLDLLDADVLT